MPDDVNDLISKIADTAGTTLDELLAIPPQLFTEAGAWQAFIERLRMERADMQLSRTSRRDSMEAE